MTVLKFLAGFLIVPVGLGLCVFIAWAFEYGPDWLAALVAISLVGLPALGLCVLCGLLVAGLI